MSAAYLGSYGPSAFGGNELPGPGTVVVQYTGYSEYTENDPPTYVCVGENDGIASWRTIEGRLERIFSCVFQMKICSLPGAQKCRDGTKEKELNSLGTKAPWNEFSAVYFR